MKNGLLKNFWKKFPKKLDDIACDACGKTLKDIKNSKDKHLCNECYSKILK